MNIAGGRLNPDADAARSRIASSSSSNVDPVAPTTVVSDGDGSALPATFPRLRGRYTYISTLGEGVSGAVYLAEQLSTGRRVAIKAIRRSEGTLWVDMLRREARLLGSVRHPSIASVLTVEDDLDGMPFLVLEYCPGRTLRRVMSSEPLPLERSLRLNLALAESLQYLHSDAARIIHLDVKPENVMVETVDDGRTETIKLLDLGLGRASYRLVADSGMAAIRDRSTADPAPALGGTYEYMPPEQFRRLPVDWTADVWAFGCVLWECLSGQRPFGSLTGKAYAQYAADAEPDWDALPEEVPTSVRALLEGCLQKSPADRADVTMAEARRTLLAALAGDSASVPRRLNNLHSRLSRFIGRRRELDTVARSMRTGRTVVVQGIPGMGKAALAREAARRLVEAREGSGPAVVCWVDLAELDEGAPAAAIVAHLGGSLRALYAGHGATDVPPPQGESAEALGRWLDHRNVLLVLAGAERVARGVEQVASSLLRAAHDLRVLVTTSAPIRIEGARTLTLGPLEYLHGTDSELGAGQRSDAAELFIDRAACAAADFRETDEAVACIERICRQLEGIPAAIEMTASQVGAVPLAEIEQHVLRDPAGLGDGAADAHSLVKAVRWSIDRLSAPERSLLARLLVFRGGFSLEGAAHVCGDEVPTGADDAIEAAEIDGRPVVVLLRSLVNAALVDFDSASGRYHLLPPVRHAAGACAAGLAEPTLESRFLAYYASLAELGLEAQQRPRGGAAGAGSGSGSGSGVGAGGLRRADWIELVQAEHANLEKALVLASAAPDATILARMVRALEAMWTGPGPLEDGRRWAAVAVARAGEVGDRRLRLGLLNAAGLVALAGSRFEEARELASRALAIAREDGDRAEADELNTLGVIARRAGRLDEALQRYAEARKLHERWNDEAGVARVRLNVAVVHKLRGRYDEALAEVEGLEAIFESIGDSARLGSLYQVEGECAYLLGRYEEALRFCGAGLCIHVRLRAAADALSCIGWIGLAAIALGRREQGIRLLREAERWMRTLSQPLLTHLQYVLDHDESLRSARAAEGRARSGDERLSRLAGGVDRADRPSMSLVELYAEAIGVAREP